MSLTPKQEKFCQEYVKTGNKSEAYRLSYSTKNMATKTVNENASRISKNSKVSARIEQLQKELAERNKMDIDECVQKLSAMARFDLLDLYNEDGTLKNLSDIPVESRMAIESLDVDEIRVEGAVIGHTKKVKLSSRRSNIIELMKHLGGYEKDNNQKKIADRVIVNMSDYNKDK
tara:strand:+ start:1805 stop:2326 length:522 start_codon:yes stop_codon:yes gene_type:complete